MGLPINIKGNFSGVITKIRFTRATKTRICAMVLFAIKGFNQEAERLTSSGIGEEIERG